MSANFLAIVLWIGSLLVQMTIWIITSSKRKGREEAQLEELGKLNDRVLELETSMANVKGWLRGSFGGTINGGV